MDTFLTAWSSLPPVARIDQSTEMMLQSSFSSQSVECKFSKLDRIHRFYVIGVCYTLGKVECEDSVRFATPFVSVNLDGQVFLEVGFL